MERCASAEVCAAFSSFTRGCGSNYILLSVTSADLQEGKCRCTSEVIDRNDGSYILRYKLFGWCSAVNITIRAKDGQMVASSPYFLKGKRPLLSERCNCPIAIEDYQNHIGCSALDKYPQIVADLSAWNQGSVNFSVVLENVKARFAIHPGAYSLCHYRIVSNKIYRKCYGDHVGFNMFSDAILLWLTRRVALPDVDLLMNLGDWPLERRSAHEHPIPILSWCGSNDTRDIVLPTYELTEATLEMMGRQGLDLQTIQSLVGQAVPWPQKIDKAFFRGRDSRQERLNLVELAKSYPDLIDAKITKWFFFRDVMQRYGGENPSVPLRDFFNYKYQINVDGTVAAYRFAYLLAGDSVVLKQDSPYYEHFYSQLKPFEHYIPFQRDLSDLVERLSWAQQHQTEVAKIAFNAQQFIREHLQPADIICYHTHALQAYSNLLAQRPTAPDTDMEFVSQLANTADCSCSTEQEELFF